MARFKVGDLKPPKSGRKPGTPNRRTIGLQDALQENGLDLIRQLAELMPRLHEEKRADILLQLMSYVYPKRKAVEVSGMNEVASREPLVILTMPRNGREAPEEIE